MAHFAKLGMNGKVIAVHVVDNKDLHDADGNESEQVGKQFLENIHNWPLWKQTSYNTSKNTHSSGDASKALRGNYAGIGFTYDEDNDIFWPPKPFPSWVKDTSDAQWHSPVGDAPALTAEQQSQNEAGTHLWGHDWNESGQTWELSNKLS